MDVLFESSAKKSSVRTAALIVGALAALVFLGGFIWGLTYMHSGKNMTYYYWYNVCIYFKDDFLSRHVQVFHWENLLGIIIGCGIFIVPASLLNTSIARRLILQADRLEILVNNFGLNKLYTFSINDVYSIRKFSSNLDKFRSGDTVMIEERLGRVKLHCIENADRLIEIIGQIKSGAYEMSAQESQETVFASDNSQITYQESIPVVSGVTTSPKQVKIRKIIGCVLLAVAVIFGVNAYTTRFSEDYDRYAKQIREYNIDYREYESKYKEMKSTASSYYSSFFRDSYESLAMSYKSLMDGEQEKIKEAEGEQRSIEVSAIVLLVIALVLVGVGLFLIFKKTKI